MKLDLASILKSYIDGTNTIYNIIQECDSWSFEKKKHFIDESFYNTMVYCEKSIPYYQNVLNKHGLTSKDFSEITSIQKLPILTKDIIRLNYDELRPSNLSQIKHTSRRSGGTTGEPIRTLVSKEAAAFETFTYFKGLKWMGWKPEMTTVKLFGGSLGIGKKPTIRQKVYQWAMGSIFIPAFELSSDNIEYYYSILSKEKQLCLVGYASAINNLTNLLKEKKIKLNNVKLLITTSEQLIEDWKINIQEYFNCDLRSYYGCGEIESLGYQENLGDESYRIPSENVYLETDIHTQELIVTQLHNRAQPLLRFKNGDVGIVNSNNYPDRINKLVGRTADYFLKKDGSKVSPIFGTFSIQRSEIPVKKYQYVQYSNGIIEFRYQMEIGELNIINKVTIQKIIDYVMNEKTIVVFSLNKPFEISLSKKHRITVTIDQPFYDK